MNSNSNIAIEIQNLNKMYKLYNYPIDRLKETIHPKRKVYHKEFYALKDINFEVKKGETLGIIGKNGAGKSTLLKILTGVLTPTSGTVAVNGKIAALLELGAGFNPAFTGIENIYLHGTVMGYSKKEIEARIPAILEFADIGDYVYQPVKMYSSGMYVRLAFSVAINVEPEVLIVDEALAVGDAKFQLKCFKRFEDIKKLGTTIIYVTHAVGQVRSFCTRGIVLDKGEMAYWGDSKEAVIKYYDIVFPKENNNENLKIINNEENKGLSNNNPEEDHITLRPEEMGKSYFGKGGALIDYMQIYGLQKPNIFVGGDHLRIDVKYRWDQEFVQTQALENSLVGNIGVGIALANEKGVYIFGCNNFDANVFVDYQKSNSAILSFDFVMPFLHSGKYFLTAAVSCGTMQNHVQLRWYDYFAELECVSCRKNVNGIMDLDYKLELVCEGEI